MGLPACVSTKLSPTYQRRRPEETFLYKTVQENWKSFEANWQSDFNRAALPKYVGKGFEDYLKCGILAHGFLRVRCEAHGRNRRSLGGSCDPGSAGQAVSFEHADAHALLVVF